MTVIDFWRSNSLVFACSIGIFGLLVGSFINVLVHRLPQMLMRDWQSQARELLELPAGKDDAPFNVLMPRSSCPHCAYTIKPWENIPLLSWLFLRGKCSACRQAISIRYPLVELACIVLSMLVAWHYGVSWAALAMLVLTWGLLAMSLIDADQQLVPDVLVLPLLWLGLIVNSFAVFVSLSDALWGAIIGYLSLWSIFWLFKLATGKDGIGYGDFKLLALIGAWGGWQVLPVTLLLSSVVGAVVGLLILRVQGHDYSSKPLAFAPYLALAGWVALLWSDKLTDSYLQLLGF